MVGIRFCDLSNVETTLSVAFGVFFVGIRVRSERDKLCMFLKKGMVGLARILLLLICVVPIEQVSGVRSPSHDAVLGHLRGRKGKPSGTTAFTGNALPRQFAGLDRLARSSCVSKHGEAACAGPLQQGRSGSRLPGAQPDIKSLAGGVGGGGGGGGLEEPRRKRTLSVRRGHRGKGDVSRDMAEYKDISFEKAWESSEGFMAIYERTVEMPGGGGGGGEGGSDSDSNGLDSTGQVEKRVVKWHVLGSPKVTRCSSALINAPPR